jgi:hypothetical protein
VNGQLVVCGVLLFPLRALSLILLILFSYPFAKIALLGLSRKVLSQDSTALANARSSVD